MHKYTDGIGADWVLEVVGIPGVIPDGVGFLNNGGTLLEVGNVGMGRTFEMDPSALVYGNKSIRGVMFYDPLRWRRVCRSCSTPVFRSTG